MCLAGISKGFLWGGHRGGCIYRRFDGRKFFIPMLGPEKYQLPPKEIGRRVKFLDAGKWYIMALTREARSENQLQ